VRRAPALAYVVVRPYFHHPNTLLCRRLARARSVAISISRINELHAGAHEREQVRPFPRRHRCSAIASSLKAIVSACRPWGS